MNLEAVQKDLRVRNEQVPIPLHLPTFGEINEVAQDGTFLPIGSKMYGSRSRCES